MEKNDKSNDIKGNPIRTYTIRQVIERINDVYYLPDIQREYCWDEKRVIDLFDSIMNGYPIGVCLVWKQHIDTYNSAKYNFYRFINKAYNNDNTGSVLERPVTKGKRKNLFAVLDGQQRLTSLYLAITGGFAVWRGRGRHRRTAPPLRELYFKPAGRNTKNEIIENEFAFYDEETAGNNSGWYKVKDIYKAKTSDEFCSFAGITKRPEKTQVRFLFDKLNTLSVITFYEINAGFSADDAVNIFMRMNSGGVPLKRTELLFALAVNNWPGGRSEIEEYLKDVHTHPLTYGSWDSVDKDFILKTCLYLFEKRISLAVDNLNKVDFETISQNWKSVTDSISDVLKFLDENGHCSQSIKSDNAIIPIVYYRYYNEKLFSDEETRKNLNAFFIVSQINGMFGASTDRVLMSLKSALIIVNGKAFCLNDFADIYSRLTGEKTALACDETMIKAWVYGDGTREPLNKGEDTRLLLASLPEYHDRKSYYYEQDHLHPAELFNDKESKKLEERGISRTTVAEWAEQKDTIGNLQLYRDRYNRNKSGKPLEEWKKSKPGWNFAYDPFELIKKDSRYKKEDSPYNIKYFDLFIKYRAELICDALENLLLVKKEEGE